MATTTFKFENGDVVLANTGRPVLIEDDAKLSQDVEQHLGQTEYPGAALETIIGRIDDEFSIRAQIAKQIRSSASAIQQLQDQHHFTDRSAKERLGRVSRLLTGKTAQNGQVNRTSYTFVVNIDSEATTNAVAIAGEVAGA